MRPVIPAVLIASLMFLLSGHAAAKEAPAAASPKKPVTAKERDAAIAKGLRYLEKTVFSLPNSTGTPRKQFTVAVTGLVALLAQDAGSRTARRKGGLADKAHKFLEPYLARTAKRTADPKQLPKTSGVGSSDQVMQYTWPFGMAGLFYGELHARGSRKTEAAAMLRTIVRVLEAAQAPNGGWGHAQVRERGKPRGTSIMDGFGGYPDTLLAVSNLVAAALALVRPLAPPKKEDVFDRAVAYFQYAELANGNFPYDPSQRAAHIDMTGVSRAAGAVLAMRHLGLDWEDIHLSRALEFVDEHIEYLAEGHGSSTFNLMLAAFLQRQRGPRAWVRFKETFFRRMLDEQTKSGAFLCICRNKAFGSTNDSKHRGKASGSKPSFFANRTDSYVTSIHTLILLLDRAWPRLMPKPAAGPTGDATATPR